MEEEEEWPTIAELRLGRIPQQEPIIDLSCEQACQNNQIASTIRRNELWSRSAVWLREVPDFALNGNGNSWTINKSNNFRAGESSSGLREWIRHADSMVRSRTLGSTVNGGRISKPCTCP